MPSEAITGGTFKDPADKPIAYRHQVTAGSEEVNGGFTTLYDGTDHADAMAAWSKAIGEGHEYVTLESLIERPVKGA